MIDGFVLLVIGGFLLLSALAFLAKVGFWMALTSRVAHPTQPVAATPSSSGDGIKKFLGIVSAILGIVSTSVGLLKECAPEPEPVPVYQSPQPQGGSQPSYTPPTAQPVYEPPPQPTYSMTCCTSAGNCMMMDGAQAVGAPCMCFNAFGAVIQGTVCN